MDHSVNRQKTKRNRSLFRKKVVIPTEHGSWSWLLVPYFTGLLVAGDWNLPALLVLIGGLAGFLIRQPASMYLNIRAGRGRKSDGALAAAWSSVFAIFALLSLVWLMVLGHTELLWLLIPMAIIITLYLAASRQRRASLRTMWMEVVGAAGLAAMAPAAYIASTDRLDNTAWTLWGLMAGQNVLGVLYVRLRVADSHSRAVNRPLVFLVHVLYLTAVILAAILGLTPWLAVVPFAGFLGRAAWAIHRQRPVANIKRFGFAEIGVEILGGLFIAAGWLL